MNDPTIISEQTEAPTVVEDTSTKEKAKNVIQEHEVFIPLDGKEDKVLLAIPADTSTRTEEALDALPNVALDSSESGEEWVNYIQQAQAISGHKDSFLSTVEREESQFKQKITSERGDLSIATPKFNDNIGTKLTGESAVIRIRALTGLGSIVQIPLWHSGFWITLKTPSEAAMLELNRRLVDEKISLGRNTRGLAFANNSVFFTNWIMDLALSHVYETTLKSDVTDNLRSLISTLDIHLIAWGLACAVWPRGFPYARSVLNSTKDQNVVIREKIDIRKCLWTDTTSLTPWQIGHMASRHGRTMTKDSVARYRDEFTRGKGRTIKLSDDLEVTLKVPSLDQYITSGQKWVNNIVDMVDRAFGLSPEEGVRDQYIMDQGKATNMRQYSHWIESINISGNSIEDPDTLDMSVDALSANDDFRDKFFKGVKTYMEDSTISVIAIPALVNEEKTDLPRFPHLLPIDAMSVFFILLVQKSLLIQRR